MALLSVLLLLPLAPPAGAQIMRREDYERRESSTERREAPAPAPRPSSPAPGSGPIVPRPAPRAPAPPERPRGAGPRISPGMPGMGGPIRRREPAGPGVTPAAPLRPSTPIRPRRTGIPPPEPGYGLRSVERVRVVPGRSTRHRWRDTQYWHHYDGRRHWYGWRAGRRFYWARPYGGYWWWYDPVGLHWSFWWGGHWWWRGPGNTLYIAVHDEYRPYDAVAVAPPPVTSDAGGAVLSPDGRRTVQLTGAASEAFLYDSSGPSPVFLRFLGRGVERVRFSGGAGGVPLRILLDFKDGTFVFADEDGRAVGPDGGASAPAPEDLPGPPPSLPSPPPELQPAPPPPPPGVP